MTYCIATQVKCITSEALRCGSHSFYTANIPYLPSPRKRSPEGAILHSIWLQLILLIYRPREDKGWVDLVIVYLQRTIYPYKWLPISCRSGVGQEKFAGQRPTFFHWATPPTYRRFIRDASRCRATASQTTVRRRRRDHQDDSHGHTLWAPRSPPHSGEACHHRPGLRVTVRLQYTQPLLHCYYIKIFPTLKMSMSNTSL